MSSFIFITCALVLVSLATAINFSCEKSAFIYTDDDKLQPVEFTKTNPIAGGILVVHANNITKTFHWNELNSSWVQDALPQAVCTYNVTTDPAVAPCFNISGAQYCEAPRDTIDTMLKKNLTAVEWSNLRPVNVKVCHTPSMAFLKESVGNLGLRFFSVYADEATMKLSPEYRPNLIEHVKMLLNKTMCS